MNRANSLLPGIDAAALLTHVQRKDFLSFVGGCFAELNGGDAIASNYHIEAIAHQLERCRLGQNRRLITAVPPRYLKSTVASIARPAFLLGHNPRQQIMVVSYAAELGQKHARDFRRILNSQWYRKLFPRTRIARDTAEEVETTQGGYRLSLSIGGSVTGRGADVIIIDDPLKSEEGLHSKTARDKCNEYYGSTLYTRLNNKATGIVVLVMQRLHDDDLVGYLLKQGG